MQVDDGIGDGSGGGGDGLHRALCGRNRYTQHPSISARYVFGRNIPCLCLAYICERRPRTHGIHDDAENTTKKLRRSGGGGGKAKERMKSASSVWPRWRRWEKKTNIGNRLDSHNIWLSLRSRVEVVGWLMRWRWCWDHRRNSVSNDNGEDTFFFRTTRNAFVCLFASLHRRRIARMRWTTEEDWSEKNERRETWK